MNWKTNQETTKRTQIPTVMLVAAMLASTAHAQTISTVPGDEFTDLAGADNNVYGNAGDDRLWGGGGSDRLNGNAGDDALYGDADLDGLAGGIGDDFLDGGDGRDWLFGGSGNDELRGGEGDDDLRGDVADCFTLEERPSGWSFTYINDVSDPNYGNVSIEETGTVYGPVDIVFFEQVSTFAGCWNTVQEGNDILEGGPGDDTLYGNGGVDRLAGGPGDDRLFGNEGSDWADYRKAASGVVVDLTFGAAFDDGDGSRDTLVGIENIFGSGQSDVLQGDQGANVLKGRGGHDVLEGRGGNDILKGDNGYDTYIFSPGDGHDRILRYANNDTIDLVAFGPSLTITEELVGADLVITVGNGSPEDVITITLVDFSGYVTYRKYGQLTA